MRSRRRVIEPRTAERPECLNNPALRLQGLGLSFGLDDEQQPTVRMAARSTCGNLDLSPFVPLDGATLADSALPPGGQHIPKGITGEGQWAPSHPTTSSARASR